VQLLGNVLQGLANIFLGNASHGEDYRAAWHVMSRDNYPVATLSPNIRP
jgi:hypothetical protein